QDLSDTIVALATPSGVGAIGVIRLSGAKAITICNQFFTKNLEKLGSHTIHLGLLKDETGRVIDEVLASIFVSPRSYTGENVIEISCHGSTFIQQQIIELFIRNGARTANRGEFTLRAFLNGKMDLSQAEAVADLIASDSSASHDLAMQQMRGGFSQEIQALRERLIKFASLIELELDFGEEDVEFANRDDLRDLVTKIKKIIHDLVLSFQLGNVIKNGVSTVIAGRPNAGKSTLLNALLNEERAIVSSIAGTTRDTIEEVLNIEGVQFRLIDTAGIREATDAIEAIGVEKTMEKIQQSTLLMYVFDTKNLPIESAKADLEKLVHEGITPVVIANKIDLLGSSTTKSAIEEALKDYPILFISAAQRENIQAIKDFLHRVVTTGEISMDNTIVSNLRHYEALEKANQSLGDVLSGLNMGITGDFLAQDIRHALSYLGEITGEISTDDLLDSIFRDFCIGK
ncbi:MAG: tRNA uridine-5-carboxymethylaminomethyl(34) synthesis GTPase MnmE, partial [Saprospiraceae bacterium]